MENLVDHVLTRCSTHDNLSILIGSKFSVRFSLSHFILVLSLSINSTEILWLCRTLSLKGNILSLHIFKFSIGLNAHDLGLLTSVNDQSVGFSLGFINQVNCLGLNLLDSNWLVTISINDLFICLTFSLCNHLLILCLGLLLILGLFCDSSLNFLFK